LSSDGDSPAPGNGAAGGTEAIAPRGLFVEHPALIVTLGYLLVSLLGLSYQWVLFRHFDVNFFLYAEVTDFLMGAFREPITFGLSLSALAVGWLAHLYARWERRWWQRREARNWFTRAYLRLTTAGFNRYVPALFFVLYSVMFIRLYADDRAAAFKEGEGQAVILEVTEGEERRPPQDAVALMMGASARFVFLYRPDAAIVEILPHENIARIVVGAGGGAAAPARPAQPEPARTATP
jgi:hypothetical protein